MKNKEPKEPTESKNKKRRVGFWLLNSSQKIWLSLATDPTLVS